jgi:HK97 family phage major capsid protein
MDLKKYYDAANAAEARVQQIAAQINDLFEADKNDEAMKLRPQLDEAKAQAKEAQQLYLSMQATTLPDGDPGRKFVKTGGDPEPKAIEDLRSSPEYRQAFWEAFKNCVTPKSILDGQHSIQKYGILLNALTETGGSSSASEGAILLPSDFDNKIRELLRTYTDLAQSQYFNIEDVTAYSGWRAVEYAAQTTGFTAHTENQTGAEITSEPKFAQKTYTIVEYMGYLPIVTNLLSDTPVNIMAYLARWFAKKAAITNTSLIGTDLKAISDTNVTDYKVTFTAIKTMLNKTLDPAVSAGASLFMNQSGLDLLDQLEDGTGRPLLQPDPSQATAFRVKGRPVVVMPNALFADTDTNLKTQIAIGDGREFLTFFRRMPFEMSTTNIGGDAWRFNNTEVKGVMRADTVVMDASAMGLLHITLPT